MKTAAKTSKRKWTAKAKLKPDDPRHGGKTQVESKALAKTVARYDAQRKSVGDKLFARYDLALVAQIAAQISREYRTPEDAAKQALRILDACQHELSARAQKRDTIINAPVPVHALHYEFRDGVRAITHQENRPGRGEEYFGKFLRSTLGSGAGAKELERLKREGFTLDEVRDFETKYEEFRRQQRKKF